MTLSFGRIDTLKLILTKRFCISEENIMFETMPFGGIIMTQTIWKTEPFRIAEKRFSSVSSSDSDESVKRVHLQARPNVDGRQKIFLETNKKKMKIFSSQVGETQN